MSNEDNMNNKGKKYSYRVYRFYRESFYGEKGNNETYDGRNLCYDVFGINSIKKFAKSWLEYYVGDERIIEPLMIDTRDDYNLLPFFDRIVKASSSIDFGTGRKEPIWVLDTPTEQSMKLYKLWEEFTLALRTSFEVKWSPDNYPLFVHYSSYVGLTHPLAYPEFKYHKEDSTEENLFRMQDALTEIHNIIAMTSWYKNNVNTDDGEDIELLLRPLPSDNPHVISYMVIIKLDANIYPLANMFLSPLVLFNSDKVPTFYKKPRLVKVSENTTKE